MTTTYKFSIAYKPFITNQNAPISSHTSQMISTCNCVHFFYPWSYRVATTTSSVLYTHPRFTFNTDQRVKRSCCLYTPTTVVYTSNHHLASAQSPLPSLTQRLGLNVLVPASRSQPHFFPITPRNVSSEPLIWSYAVRLATVEGLARLLPRYNFALGTPKVPAGCCDLFEKGFGKCGRRTFAWGCLRSLKDISDDPASNPDRGISCYIRRGYS